MEVHGTTCSIASVSFLFRAGNAHFFTSVITVSWTGNRYSPELLILINISATVETSLFFVNCFPVPLVHFCLICWWVGRGSIFFNRSLRFTFTLDTPTRATICVFTRSH